LVIAGEFGTEEVVCPIVLKVAHVSPKVLFHDCVHGLSLPIGLWVEGRREAGIDLQAFAQVFPEARRELWSSIRHDGFREAVVTEDSVTEQVRESIRRDRRVAGEQVALLGEKRRGQ